MNGLPYYKAYPRDFIEGTVGMSFELKAAYRLVLDLIYMHGGHLPNDDRYISGVLSLSVKRWKSIRDELVSMGKLEISGEFLTNNRAFIELESSAKLSGKMSENRSRPNKNKDLQSRKKNHTDTDTYTDIYSSSLRSEEISSSLSSEEPAPAKPKKKSVNEILQSVLSQKTAQAIVAHRQKLRKGLTERAAELLADKLSKAPQVGMTPDQAADVMIERGWQSIELDWLRNVKPQDLSASVDPFKGGTVMLRDGKPIPTSPERWAKRVEFWRKGGEWNSNEWGAKPGDPGCNVPTGILSSNQPSERAA